jgi:hypothetical protein
MLSAGNMSINSQNIIAAREMAAKTGAPAVFELFL